MQSLDQKRYRFRENVFGHRQQAAVGGVDEAVATYPRRDQRQQDESASTMRAILQRVTEASVTVEDEQVGKIGLGLMILLGVGQGDDEKQASWLAGKIAGLRIFDDGEGKMNLSLTDVGGEALVVSQFTLYADCRKGRRPSFVNAAPPEEANRLYQFFCDRLRDFGCRVETGRFQAAMAVELINDGPVTIILDSP